MKLPLAALLLASSLPLPAQLDHRPPGEVEPGLVLTNFAFASCCKQDQPQPLWPTVTDTDPQLLLWLGDIIYADTEDMAVMRKKYGQLAADPGYQALVQTCPVIAIWDDHDYGENDAGDEYPMKAESKEVFLDFFNEPAESARRKRAGNYTSYLFGPEGKRVQIILTDTRTFRSPLKKGPKAPYGRMGRYLPDEDPKATMLGEEQWQWLENELKKPADLRIFGNATQVVCEHDGFEAWSNMPREKERLLSLLKSHQTEGVIMLSGDSHHGEIHLDEHDGLYPLWEFTSSGINQGLPFTEDQNRVGPAVEKANYGQVQIDWEARKVTVTISSPGVRTIAETLSFDELTFADKNLTPTSKLADAARTWTTRWGPLTLTPGENGRWTGRYGDEDDGRVSLLEKDGKLTGNWERGTRSGTCQFWMTRHGKYLRGISGTDRKPMLTNWNGW